MRMETYRKRVERLKRQAGQSVEDVHFTGRQEAIRRGEPTVSLSTIQKLLAGKQRATWRPSVDALRVLAYGLGVEPVEFPEYRLAQARDELDEQAVGLEAAVGKLEKIEAAGIAMAPKPAKGRGRSGRAALRSQLDEPEPGEPTAAGRAGGRRRAAR